jgi:Brix domain
MVELNEIKNKIKRQEVYHKNKLLKKKTRTEKIKNQIPKTTENMRKSNDEDVLITRVKSGVLETRDTRNIGDSQDLEGLDHNDLEDLYHSDKDSQDSNGSHTDKSDTTSKDNNVQIDTSLEEINETTEDINQDLFSTQAPKKILVTTSKRPTPNGYKFTTEFTKIFPNAEFIKRQSQFSIQKICQLASERDYTTVMVVNEDNKTPNKITIINLPFGPTAHFNLSSIKLHKDILNHAKLGIHKPELVLNGFGTRLGQTVGR